MSQRGRYGEAFNRLTVCLGIESICERLRTCASQREKEGKAGKKGRWTRPVYQRAAGVDAA
ncbi:hypothetical protein [Burkholderia anthina]|uniref:hypothetical protein n=1 Tax=Burkholderia anthina TaxID=179879 RepID=UPI00158E0DED|nr:hypothetical protein [Burkholderia anthina]